MYSVAERTGGAFPASRNALGIVFVGLFGTLSDPKDSNF